MVFDVLYLTKYEAYTIQRSAKIQYCRFVWQFDKKKRRDALDFFRHIEQRGDFFKYVDRNKIAMRQLLLRVKLNKGGRCGRNKSINYLYFAFTIS